MQQKVAQYEKINYDNFVEIWPGFQCRVILTLTSFLTNNNIKKLPKHCMKKGAHSKHIPWKTYLNVRSNSKYIEWDVQESHTWAHVKE